MSAPTRIHPFIPFFPSEQQRFNPSTTAVVPFVQKKFPEEVPPAGARAFRCKVEVAPGAALVGWLWGNHIFLSSDLPLRYTDRQWNVWPFEGNRQHGVVEVDDPFFEAEIVGPATTKLIRARQHRRDQWGMHRETGWASVTDSYEDPSVLGTWDRTGRTPFLWAPIRITAKGAEPVVAEFCFTQPSTGVARLAETGPTVTVEAEFLGYKRQWEESLRYFTHTGQRNGWNDTLTNEALQVLYKHLRGSTLPDGADAWWQRFFEVNADYFLQKEDLAGLTAVLKSKKLRSTIEALQKDHPLDWAFFQWLQCSATVEKHKNNALLAAFLQKTGGSVEAVLESLQVARNETAPTTPAEWRYYSGYDDGRHGYCFASRRAICLSLPGAADKVQEQEAKADWTKRKGNAAQADGIGIDAERFPLLRAAVESGNIPTSVFHQPDKTPVNVEFPLWERALQREGWASVLYEIAQDASRRSTYEKDITPYLAFMFRLEKYLERHTGKKWAATPKYVQSTSELEMGDEAEGGTVKRRSAFTPIADNENCTVVVPYVAVVVSGVRTQWCYARHYHLFEEGFTDPVSGGMVIQDLEEKLNGRDDYGLCYYDLIGTSTANGYPTFLIIFERLKGHTRVHFHRVRPQRVRNGVKTPACHLIEACYQYMAGNVPAKDIDSQQGDLIFIRHENDPVKAGAKVKEPQEATKLAFESHQFDPLVEGERAKLYESVAKEPKNRLGFLQVPAGGLTVRHPEHEDIEKLCGGWYEVRRARSWEANPVAIWSLTID